MMIETVQAEHITNGENYVPNTPAEDDCVRSSVAGQRGCEESAEHIERISGHLDAKNILDATAAHIVRYVAMPSPNAVVATTLWAVATHLAGNFDTATRLVARSPEKRSGKTRLVNEVLGGLVCDPLPSATLTAAYVYRKLEGITPPTFLVDEADVMFGTKSQAEMNEKLRGVFNAGYRRGNPVRLTVGPSHTPAEYPSFAMVAFAGIGKLPDTIEDRAVIVPMRRRKNTEKVETFRHKRDFAILHAMRDRIAEWADTVREQITGDDIEDIGVVDRAADVWEPLVVVADLAGGAWPELARRAAKEMTEDAEADDQEDKESTQLLLDIRSVFKREFMTSLELVSRLKELDESPWASREIDLTSAKLGIRLKQYGIKTGQETNGKRRRGYELTMFEDAFDRYLAPITPS